MLPFLLPAAAYASYKFSSNLQEEARDNPTAETDAIIAAALVETGQDLWPPNVYEDVKEEIDDEFARKVKEGLQDMLTEILGTVGVVIGTAANQVGYDIDPLMLSERKLEDGDTLMQVGIYSPELSWSTLNLMGCNLLFGTLAKSVHNLTDSSGVFKDNLGFAGISLKESHLAGRETLFRWNDGTAHSGWEAWA